MITARRDLLDRLGPVDGTATPRQGKGSNAKVQAKKGEGKLPAGDMNPQVLLVDEMGRLHFHAVCGVQWGAGPRGLFVFFFSSKYPSNRVALQCGLLSRVRFLAYLII